MMAVGVWMLMGLGGWKRILGDVDVEVGGFVDVDVGGSWCVDMDGGCIGVDVSGSESVYGFGIVDVGGCTGADVGRPGWMDVAVSGYAGVDVRVYGYGF